MKNFSLDDIEIPSPLPFYANDASLMPPSAGTQKDEDTFSLPDLTQMEPVRFGSYTSSYLAPKSFSQDCSLLKSSSLQGPRSSLAGPPRGNVLRDPSQRKKGLGNEPRNLDLKRTVKKKRNRKKLTLVCTCCLFSRHAKDCNLIQQSGQPGHIPCTRCHQKRLCCIPVRQITSNHPKHFSCQECILSKRPCDPHNIPCGCCQHYGKTCVVLKKKTRRDQKKKTQRRKRKNPPLCRLCGYQCDGCCSYKQPPLRFRREAQTFKQSPQNIFLWLEFGFYEGTIIYFRT